MRQQAVKAVGQGEWPAQIARVLGIKVRSVYRWIAAYASVHCIEPGGEMIVW